VLLFLFCFHGNRKLCVAVDGDTGQVVPDDLVDCEREIREMITMLFKYNTLSGLIFLCGSGVLRS
jgi:hypothetical protein